jgi:conjugative transfer region protein (TIGR03750 family)
MNPAQPLPREALVTFLPHRLNRQPVVVLGLTADELWICAGLSGVLGLMLGVALAVFLGNLAVIPTVVVLVAALGIFAGGGLLRRLKRGRPETWCHRQLQWWLARRFPAAAAYLDIHLITRSGAWSIRRTVPRFAP